MSEATGVIPSSDALREVGDPREALQELNRRAAEILSEDPTKCPEARLDEMILLMRSQREQWEKLEAAGATRSAPKTAKAFQAATSKSLNDVM